MNEGDRVTFEREVAAGCIRVIEVPKEVKVDLMTLLQPEERWLRELPDGRSAIMLWTMAAGTRALLFVAEKLP